MKIFQKILQALADFVVGVAIYFALNALIPALGDIVIFFVSLVSTVLFAELVEMKLKK